MLRKILAVLIGTLAVSAAICAPVCHGTQLSAYAYDSSASQDAETGQTEHRADLGIGESKDLSVFLPEGTNAAAVRAEIADTSVVSAEQGLIIKALAVGETKVQLINTADETILAVINITVHKAPSNIFLVLKSTTLGIGESCTLVYSFNEGEYTENVIYTSSSAAVAEVDETSGVVTAKAEGTAVITAKTYNGKSATCTITVKRAPTSVSAGLASTTIGIGEKCDLNAKVPTGEASKVIRYESSDTSVATVDEVYGIIVAQSEGTTVITAKTYNGMTDTCIVTVKRAPTSVSAGLTSTSLGIGEKCDLNAKVPTGEASKVVTYTSSNTSVATVNKYNGVVVAKNTGTTVITARTYNGMTGTCVITVKKAPVKVSIGLKSTTLGIGEKCDLNAKVPAGEASKVITYTSSNAYVATVNKYNGVITAQNTGTAVITARTYNGRTDTCVVTVKRAPTSFKLNKSKVALLKTGKYDLNAVFNSGEISKVVTYTSSNTSVATVNKYNGVVTAKSVGWTYVTARTFNGRTCTCLVVVPMQKNVSTVKGSVVKDSASWSGKTLTSFKKGTKINILGYSGKWLKAECNGTIGYIYNKAVTGKANYSSITTSTLPVVADDWLFDNGTSISAIFKYAESLYYATAPKQSVEQMVVRAFKLRSGACYHYASLMYYLLDRAGYDVYIIQGESSPNNEHWWNLVKTSEGWRHYDATPFLDHDPLYGATDAQTAKYMSKWDRSKYPAAN